ncbi:hypothetical protein L0F63_000240 [Massospora cicadina]|nr:hypothetical protein L0F63_000240 [Massospora cicadina]
MHSIPFYTFALNPKSQRFGHKMNPNHDPIAVVFGKVEPHLGLDIAMLVLGAIGLIINVLLLHITRVYREAAHAIDITLIRIVSLFDTTACVYMVAGIFLRWAVGEWILTNDGLWCRASAVMFSGSTLITLVFTAILALTRYLAICRGWKIDSLRSSIYAIILVIAILLMLIILVTCYSVIVPPSGLYCSPRFWSESIWNRFFGIVTLGLLIFSLTTIPLCYLGLTLHYRRLVRRMGGVKRYYSLRRIQKSTYSLIAVSVSYAVSTFPEFIVVGLVVSRVIQRSSILDGIVILLLVTTTIINPLFSLLMHDDINRCFLSYIGINTTIQIQPL